MGGSKDWLNHAVAIGFILILINTFVTTCASTKALDKVESLEKEKPPAPTVVNNVKVEQNCMLWGNCEGANSSSEIGSSADEEDNWPWR